MVVESARHVNTSVQDDKTLERGHARHLREGSLLERMPACNILVRNLGDTQ